MDKETKIQIFCIIVLIVLNISIYINGRSLTCDGCIIKFKYSDSVQTKTYDVKLIDLFNNYSNDTCLVENTNGGFLVR